MANNNTPLRIAMVMGKMENGGVESVIMNYYRHIDRSRIQFDFIVDDDSSLPQREEIENMGGHIYIVPPYQKITSYIKTLIELFKNNQYKIVHANINTLSVFPLFAAKKAGVLIRTVHNHSTAGKGEIKKNILKYMLRPFAKVNATNYVACSNYAAEWMFGKKSVQKGQVQVFKNAIDTDKFRYNPEIRTEMRKELGVEDKFVLGHIGRFCYQKNHDFLIDIFKAVYSINPNAVLILAGEGELQEDIKKKVKSLGLEESVKFLGVRNDVHRLYQAMDVFVLPSRYEGLPVVGVEAQAAGLPCVFSTAMTKETKMLDSTVMLSLSGYASEWAGAVLNYTDFKRIDMSEQIRDKGFDIVKESNKFINYYNAVLK